MEEQPTQPIQQDLSFVDKALEAAKRMEAANAKQEELIKRHEVLAARMALGGRSEAGQTVEKKEETPAEYARRISGGRL